MELTLVFEYIWVLLIIIGLEGILAADNAVVLAVMVKHLPGHQQKKALFYGLIGAFIMRFGALFLISFLVNVWQIQALGAFYLLAIAIHNLQKRWKNERVQGKRRFSIVPKGNGFWMTVLKVELADLAFAVDSMLAAVAIAITLPEWGAFTIGGIDGGQYLVMFLGGFVGLVIMRFAATWFVTLLNRYPALETTAFLIVGWVGVKLLVTTLSHSQIGILPASFPESVFWKMIFWGVLLILALGGFIYSRKKALEEAAIARVPVEMKKANSN